MPGARRGDRAGGVEVGEPQVAVIAQQEVGGFDVAVHDAEPVAAGEREAGGDGHPADLDSPEPAAVGDDVGDRAPCGLEVQELIVGTVQWDDPGPLDQPQRSGLGSCVLRRGLGEGSRIAGGGGWRGRNDTGPIGLHVRSKACEYMKSNQGIPTSPVLVGGYASRVHELTIGLLGCGNVGGALVELLAQRRGTIAQRTGVDLRIGAIAVRSVDKYRDVIAAPDRLTDDPAAMIDDPSIDLVVELIGGIEPARSLILRALELGKPVVTGNKELLAAHGPELYAAAAASGVDLLFEAAVAGGIPLMRPLRESLVGEDISRVMGIINGTTNFILTKMSTEGADYADVLAEAQALGFAEADPTADVEGFDAGAKAAIIASIVFGAQITSADVQHEGISKVSAADIETAARLGYVIKALAVIERHDGGSGPEVSVQVHPAMVPTSHPLAGVNDAFNAVFVEGAAVGDLMFYGRGAGGSPTASAVLGDVVDAAVNKAAGASATLTITEPATLRSPDDLSSQYYITLQVTDRPGVLAQVAAVFGDNGVSIQTMEQKGTGEAADLCFIVHDARHASVVATLDALRDLDAVSGIGSVIRLIADN